VKKSSRPRLRLVKPPAPVAPAEPVVAPRPFPALSLPGPHRVVPHARPWIGADEEEAALRVLRSARLAPGAEAARLEGLVARMAGGADAVALSSGTTALTLALLALGVKRGDRVAIPAYTCAAVLHAVRAAGGAPLLCDIDPSSLALDADDLRRRAGAGGVRAVVVVHPFGLPVPVEPYRTAGTILIEDCAQSPGARLGTAPVGSWGDAAVFSFAPTKPFTGGGPGGAIAARDPAIVRAVRDLAGHDEKEDDRAHQNALMGDLHAAIAAAQIGRAGDIVARRRHIVRRYAAAFAAHRLPAPREAAGAQPVFHRYLVALRGGAAAAIQALQARGIQARPPVFRPLHRLVPGSPPCPGADEAQARWVSLPLSPVLRDDETERVIDEVHAWLSRRS
jgi:dTDP-4-amino-4,6-dideoxygalactose transaminase